MAKYKGAYRDELENEQDLTYAEELELERQAASEPQAKDPEEDTYKKRYGDLRRHAQLQMQQKFIIPIYLSIY